MPQDSPSRKLEQYIVRFPDGMRDRLKAEAAKNNRSLNAEIIARLSASFGPSSGTMAAVESGQDGFSAHGPGAAKKPEIEELFDFAELTENMTKMIEEVIDNSIDAKIKKYGLLLGREAGSSEGLLPPQLDDPAPVSPSGAGGKDRILQKSSPSRLQKETKHRKD